MDKLDGKTMDIVKDNIEKLKELFPTIVKEDKIDFEELELLLGENINRNKEQYSFVWNGKTEATKLAQKRSTGTLRPCKEESKNWDTTQNLYIEGDNLEVLKLLQTSYNGRIKMIYIDPPYNTGHDFVYKDNFEDNIANYKEITGQAQKSNADTDGRYHTNWLNMMYPRLKLARTLLAKEGVIFISIDDNEVDNLKKICNDVFGEDNFVAQLPTIMNLKGNNDEYGFAGTHEYTLVYSKKVRLPEFKNLRIKDKSKIEDEWQTDEYGYYKLGTLKGGGENGARELRPNLFYPIYLSKDNSFSLQRDEKHNYEILPISNGKEMTWRWSKEKLLNEPYNISVEFKDGEFQINRKIRPQNNIPSIKPKTLFYKESYSSGNGVKVIKDLFGTRIFNYSKPLDLIMDFLEICTDGDDLVLDFFSGTATTAHAVMQLNSEDGGNRKFICVQLPELTEQNSEAFKQGYKNICEIGKERIRRAGSKLIESKKQEIQEEIQKYQKLLADKTKTELLIRQDEFELTQNDKDIKNAMEYDNNSLSSLLNKNNNKLEAYWDRKEKLSQQTDELEQSKTTLFELQEQLKNLEANADLDTGFKVFKLDSSNLRKWNNEPTDDVDEVAKRLQLSLEYLEPNRTDFDLVYEIMLKHGIDLSKPVVKTANDKGYIVEDDDYKLLICAYRNLTLEDIESFVNENVGTYIFADHCFADDNLLINTQEMLKAKGKEMRLF